MTMQHIFEMFDRFLQFFVLDSPDQEITKKILHFSLLAMTLKEESKCCFKQKKVLLDICLSFSLGIIVLWHPNEKTHVLTQGRSHAVAQN